MRRPRSETMDVIRRIQTAPEELPPDDVIAGAVADLWESYTDLCETLIALAGGDIPHDADAGPLRSPATRLHDPASQAPMIPADHFDVPPAFDVRVATPRGPQGDPEATLPPDAERPPARGEAGYDPNEVMNWMVREVNRRFAEKYRGRREEGD